MYTHTNRHTERKHTHTKGEKGSREGEKDKKRKKEISNSWLKNSIQCPSLPLVLYVSGSSKEELEVREKKKRILITQIRFFFSFSSLGVRSKNKYVSFINMHAVMHTYPFHLHERPYYNACV